MEKEYIEREALLKRLCDDNPSAMEDYYYNAIKDAPAADVVEVVHGEWVPRKIMSRHPGAKNYYCSICETITAETGKYCGNCGAKMDGERKEV